MSLGSSKSKTSSTSQSGAETFGTAVNPVQQGYFNNLWASGQNLANVGAGQDIGYQGLNQATQALQGPGMQTAMGTLQNQANYGVPGMSQAMGQLAAQPYSQSMNTLGQLQRTGVDPMMDIYARQLGQQFNEQIMPGLRTEGIATGGYGGSRAGIAQGLAGARMGQQMQDFAGQLYGQQMDRALQAATAQGQQQYQSAMGLGGLAGQQAAQQYQSAIGLGGLAGQQANQYLQNAAFGMGVPWYAQKQFAGLLGSPIIENLGGESWSGGRSSGGSSGFNIGLGSLF